jgi:erythrocyte band 7 integral membrane protein
MEEYEGITMANPGVDIVRLPGLKIAEDINMHYSNPKIYDQEEKLGCAADCLGCCGNISRCLCFPCAPCGCGPLMQIKQGEIGLLLQQGKLKAKLGPGLHTYNTCLDELIRVDMKTQIIDLPKQLLITKDNVTIMLSAFVAYNIDIPEYAIFRVENIPTLVTNLTMGTMKSIVATLKLNELLTKRREVEAYITRVIDKKTEYYGLNVSSIDTMSMDLPKQLEEALVSAALSERECKSKVINAKGNLESAKIIKNSAQELSKNKVSLQLQYFEVLKKISEEKPVKLILPYFITDQS